MSLISNVFLVFTVVNYTTYLVQINYVFFFLLTSKLGSSIINLAKKTWHHGGDIYEQRRNFKKGTKGKY